jgi:para-aminobenzoate synthetase component 1
MQSSDAPVPFQGGAVGYLSYDLGRLIEHIPSTTCDDLELPELCLGFYESGFCFDNLTGQVFAVSTGLPEEDDERRLKLARERLAEMKGMLARHKADGVRPRNMHNHTSSRCKAVTSNFSRKAYIAAVEKARQYIIDGDIFEVNLSQRFQAKIDVTPYELYSRLREVNPAPFACYLGFDDVQVVGASPERFLCKKGDRVETRPIKGTRRRGTNPEEDSRLAAELLASPKDHAENMMIVDLERNDLGRVCRFGSIHVSELAILETYPTVFHLTSTIEGRLRRDVNVTELLRAAFPGGSITGAPKVRSMEIIEELEHTRRSAYTGSMGYIGFNGNIDLNIAIRTILVKGSEAYFQTGGAVVFDSDPSEEYQETLDKAKALFAALGISDIGETGA